jgi:hypothetical protein
MGLQDTYSANDLLKAYQTILSRARPASVVARIDVRAVDHFDTPNHDLSYLSPSKLAAITMCGCSSVRAALKARLHRSNPIFQHNRNVLNTSTWPIPVERSVCAQRRVVSSRIFGVHNHRVGHMADIGMRNAEIGAPTFRRYATAGM